MKMLLLALLVAFALACTKADPPPSAGEALVETGQTVQIDPSEVPSPPEPTQANAPISSPEQARLRELLAAMSDASEEAAAAEGDTPCERAYQSSRRFADSLRQRMGGEPLPADTPARERAFVAGCGELPAGMQQCMIMSYSLAHQDECAALRRDMDEDTRSAVQALMADLGPLGEAAAAAPAPVAAPAPAPAPTH